MNFSRILNTRKINRILKANCSYKVLNYNHLSSAQNNLAKQLSSKIKFQGPITVAEYMKEVLINPTCGYYMHNDVFGEAGDFITSPELGQLFGELIAIWFLNEWSKAGSPKPIQLVELGPGRGSLCQDILRVFKQFQLTEKVSVHLVEVSPHLSDLQSRRLCAVEKIGENEKKDETFAYHKCVSSFGSPVSWYKHLDDVPNAFSLIVAHEFFDVLPVHKFQKTEDGYREILVDVDPKDENKFRFVLSRDETIVGKLFIRSDELRQHVEVSPEGLALIQKIGMRLECYGGIGLIADYGHDGTGTDTLRAFKKHQQQDPLVEPGTADLTADVDFLALKKAATEKNHILAYGPISQREFLLNMGIEYRLETLKKKANENQLKGLDYTYDLMTHPEKMGTRFKFLALLPKVLEKILAKYPPTGFQ